MDDLKREPDKTEIMYIGETKFIVDSYYGTEPLVDIFKRLVMREIERNEKCVTPENEGI